jgi:hypothetical protein
VQVDKKKKKKEKLDKNIFKRLEISVIERDVGDGT